MSDKNNAPDGVSVEDLQRQLDEANARADRFKGEAGKFKRLSDKFDGIDLDDLKSKAATADKFAGLDEDVIAKAHELAEIAKSEEDKKILKERGIEGLVEHRMRGNMEETSRKMDALQKAADDAERARLDAVSAMREKDFMLEVSAAVEKAKKFNDGVARFVAMDVRPLLKYTDDGRTYLERDGERLLSVEDPTRDMTIEEFVAIEVPKISPALVRKAEGVGAKGSGGGSTSDNPFMDAHRATEQRQIRNSDPARAKRLAQEARDAGKGDQIKAANV